MTELRRRNVFRVAATYIVASWLIIQVVSSISAPLNFPGWFEAAVIVLLLIGFPIAIVLGWAFELTPEGIKATPSENCEPPPAWRALDTALVLALLLVTATIAWDRLDTGANPKSASTAHSPEKSVAVLPFADMSPNGDQQYFGDGIAEELLDELTRLDGLRVASRTSSFAYRDRGADTRAIGEDLNVATVLEGSVRKSGDRIRITAQLIDAADGYHLWSRSYERELIEIFDIQDEIAGAVAGALGVSLGVGDVNAFRGAGTGNVEAYDAYLRGLGTPLFEQSDERIRMFEQAVDLDPAYAASWAALGLTIGATMWTSSVDRAPDILDRAIPVLLRAVELGPDSAYAYSMLATVNYARFDWIQSEEYHRKAMELQADGDVLANYANMLMRSGRSAEAIRYSDLAARADRNPVDTSSQGNRDYALAATGGWDELRDRIQSNPGPYGQYLEFVIALNSGDAVALEEALSDISLPGVAAGNFINPILHDIHSPESVLSTLRSVYADSGLEWPSKHHDVAVLAAFFGDPEFALEAMSYEARLTTIRYGAIWYPVMSEARRLPAFKDLVTDVNLVDYWRTHGWTDHCQPVGDDDFECNTSAY